MREAGAQGMGRRRPPPHGLKGVFKDKELQSRMFQSHFSATCFPWTSLFPPSVLTMGSGGLLLELQGEGSSQVKATWTLKP